MFPFFRRTKKQIARLEIKGAIGSGTRTRVLEILKEVEARKFPALLLRIDSPGGTVGDSFEIYSALKRLQEKCKIVASYGNISASGGVFIGAAAPHVIHSEALTSASEETSADHVVATVGDAFRLPVVTMVESAVRVTC